MLVDDSPSSLVHFRTLIESVSDVECCLYEDPCLALQEAAGQDYAVVFVDYMMPRMNGVELIRALRARPDYEHVPIVMITATNSDPVRLEALAAGATDFLSKSTDGVEMQVRMRNLIQMSGAVRKLNSHAASLAQDVEAATRSLLDREAEMIFRLSLAVEYRDSDTGGHTVRVANYSRMIAEELGLSPGACRDIYLASPLHDVGKVAVPDAILLKPGRLDPEEFAVIREHAAIGERILGGSTSSLVALAGEIAGSHHERWDGTGYPNGLGGRLIPLPARIVAIADVFDALTTERPYKSAMLPQDAFAYVEAESGRHFDPACVRAFMAARGRVLSFLEAHDWTGVKFEAGSRAAGWSRHA